VVKRVLEIVVGAAFAVVLTVIVIPEEIRLDLSAVCLTVAILGACAWILASTSIPFKLRKASKSILAMTILLFGAIGAMVGIACFFVVYKISPIVSPKNIESHLVEWAKDLKVAEIHRLPSDPNSLFRYLIRPQAGQSALMVQCKKTQPKFLLLETGFDVEPAIESALAKMSSDDRNQLKSRLDKRITKKTALSWVLDSSYRSIRVVKAVAISGISEESFVEATMALNATTATIQDEADDVFSSLLPVPPVEITQETVDESNIDAFINQWANASSLSINKWLPSNQTLYFGYTLSFPDGKPIGVMRLRERPEYVIFKVQMPLDFARAFFDSLPPKKQSELVAQLGSEWKSDNIVAAVEQPFASVTVFRLMRIAGATEKAFLRNLKLAHFEAVSIESRMRLLLRNPAPQPPIPISKQFLVIDTDSVKEVEANLILVTNTDVFLSTVENDPKSRDILRDMSRLFDRTGHSVHIGRIRESNDSPPKGRIGLFLPENCPQELANALRLACPFLKRTVEYYPPMSKKDVQIIIGPP
jgi:hypothetical protein